jgi:transposase
MCLFAKRLEKGRFIWPSPADGVVRLTAAQLSMLLEGIDWEDADPNLASGAGRLRPADSLTQPAV